MLSETTPGARVVRAEATYLHAEFSTPRGTLTDETRATLPPDFRDPRIHHAYRVGTQPSRR